MGFEFNEAVNRGKERIVPAYSDVGPRMYLSTALPDYNGAGIDLLTAVLFNSQPLGLAIAAAASTSSAFLMCH
jgi:hypothetical protein